ncbi:MAG: DHH family phosphoesterase [Phycisphaerales bacterium]
MSTDAYATNTTPHQIVERLRHAKSIAVITHRKADGDALGSTLALVRTLRHLDHNAFAVFPGPWIDVFDPLIHDTPSAHIGENDDPSDLPVAEPDAIVLVDTGSRQQLGAMVNWVEQRADRAIIVDHHASGDAELAEHRWVEVGASAACEMVAKLCAELNRVDTPARLPLDVAEPLYLGIATDTGWFRYSNTRSSVMRLAADLLDAGVDHNRLLRLSEQSDPPERVFLLAKALSSLRLDHDDQIATLVIRRKDLEELGLQNSDSGTINDRILSIATVRATAIITEVDANASKASLRSKPPLNDHEPDADVNVAAQQFGGGGHKRAAGARLPLPVDQARDAIVKAIAQQLQ